ncbi:SDR family NAD(P)-dependent oxidoreductase [Ovoidimarina sediminis]|uniref:SDR family NAD(P)-dependent oxidoreductase n=1 Tax=Ovoidimarina sediminis TaxID=3079856 RepID=UPI002910E3EB|nr:SDR family NAD(P)-dependent oxidoreductase [Rhodophyticola sp. MJ-SS7]MDU8944238.1 SDR family NAD(P)-dependent oxidoreductase [Rhodophyticola sp. MJ-SS7]
MALVTGAGSGIGRAIAHRLGAGGARVICTDIDLDGAQSIAGEIEEAGGSALAFRMDISCETSVRDTVAGALAETGHLNAVAANAGIMVEGDLLSLSLDDWNRAMAVNATGAFLTARATLPYLIESGGGSLVFTASTVALSGMKGVAAYSASKGAVAALTRQIAADYASRGIRVNAVAPGAVRTPLSESQFRARADTDAEVEALLTAVIQRYPISRWGMPEDIAALVAFLLGRDSGWITGQIIPVDGGLLETR